METQAVEQEIIDIPTPEPAVGHRTGRILVAEDDVHMRRLIAATLRAAGYRVVEACDGAEVLERVESTIWHERHGLFGAIVADMNMPALTGLDVLAALRCAEIDTPFILVTAFGDEGVRAEAKWLGATAVLDKPFGLDALRSSVRSALQGSGPGGVSSPIVTPLRFGAGRRPH